METVTARRVELKVFIDGFEATSYLAPSLLSFEYTDQASGKSDEVQLELHDRDEQWINGWLPLKGSVVVASLTALNWAKTGRNLLLNCGSFKCDEPAEYSGPPNKVRIKAVSAALTDELRETKRTKGWENFSLQGVATEIATSHGLKLYYDAPSHQFKRQDQRRETDLAFLERLGTDRGVNLKVHNGLLILFNALAADARPTSFTISRRDFKGKFENQIVAADYSFKISSADAGYNQSEVKYHDSSTRELRSATFKVPSQPEVLSTNKSAGKTLTIDSRVESEADAQTLAQSRLRKANQGELTGSVTIMGHPGLVAGMTIQMADFGIFSGKYFVEKVTHRVSDKYTTSAELRQTLPY